MTITGEQKQTGLCYRAFKSDSAERADMKSEIIFPRYIFAVFVQTVPNLC